MPLFKSVDDFKLGDIVCNDFKPKDYNVFRRYYEKRPIESFNCDSMFQFYLSKHNDGWKPKSWIKSVWFEYKGFLCIVDVCKRSKYLSDYPFNENGEPMPIDILDELYIDTDIDQKIINVTPYVIDFLGKQNLKDLGYKVVVNSGFGLDHIDDNKIIKENKGKYLANLRHTSRRFERFCPNRTVIEYDGSTYMYCVFENIYNDWLNNEGSKYDVFDNDFYFTMLKYFDKIGYRAFAFRDNDSGEWIGMTSYFQLNSKMAYCFARKFKTSYIGSSDYSQIYISTKMLEDGIKYCHNGSDGGEGPLRFFKDKMHSVYLNKSYTIKMGVN